MPITILDERIWFPPPSSAMPDGLLAAGGDLSLERLLLAYRNGIFPWYNEDEPPLWWSPDPRFVLFPEELRVSKTMQQLMRKNEFEYRYDFAFERVIRNCAVVKRKGMSGTWINGDVERAYVQLFESGNAHCAEAWQNGELVGGLYGVRLGRVFFGESMFSNVSNASKFAFIRMVQDFRQSGGVLVDCQVYTRHLESLGARMIPRKDFLKLIADHIQ